MRQNTIHLPKKRQQATEQSEDSLSVITQEHPSDWIKGALLNVRNTGPDYTVTLYPEEYDPRSPERALKFTNPAECQNFISNWYQREHFDPRAF